MSAMLSMPGKTPRRVAQQAVRAEYRYASFGLVLGSAAILGGVVLGLNGVAGSASWTAKIFGLVDSTVTDATSGVVLFIVGVMLVLITRARVNLH